MYKEHKKALKIAGVYTGVILGAGFASGQELLNFFVKYDKMGFIGLIMSGVIFALCGWAVLHICFTKKIKNFNEFIYLIMGDKLGWLIECTVAVFLIVLFATMLAAGGATLNQSFGLPYMFGVLALAIVCFITFLFDMDGLVEISAFLAPILVLGGIFVGVYTFVCSYVSTFASVKTVFSITQNWLFGTLVYCFYNVVTAISVLCSLGKVNDSKKAAKWGGIIGGLCMGFLGVAMALPLYVNFGDVVIKEIPILYIVNKFGKIISVFYLFVFLAAVLTTALGNGFAFIQWAQTKTKINSLVLKIIVTVVAIVLANFGFSNFVSKVYPIFGFIGFIEILCIMLYLFKEKIKGK